MNATSTSDSLKSKSSRYPEELVRIATSNSAVRQR